MKAIVYRRYGPPDVLKLEEIEKPTSGSDEIFIRVRAASLNPYDWHFMRGTPYFLRLMAGLGKPKYTRIGADVAGQVEAVGKNVTRFKAGDAVFGACRGAFAEYACAGESKVVLKPEEVTFEQAACIPIAGLTALQSLRDKGHIKAGQKVLINGASGGVGTFAVQIAKNFGADVTGVCSARNVEMVRSIGAQSVIDYTQQDFTNNEKQYDLIIDCVGNHSLLECMRSLNSKGILVMAGGEAGRWMVGAMGRAMVAPILSRLANKKVAVILARLNKEDLTALGELVAAGKVTPVVDRRYRLREVPEAMRYLEEGHARGKVVISVE